MDSEVEDSKLKDDFYITKFLEILLNFKNEWNEKDEDFTERERRLPAYFHELQEGLTSYDIKLEMGEIRKLYKKEALKLLKARKSRNESKLPWFSIAESLFSHTVNWEKEIIRDQMRSSSDLSVRTNDGILANIQSNERILSHLPPTHMLFSSKNAIVTSTFATTSVLPTRTSALTCAALPLLVANSKPYTDKGFSLVTSPFPSTNSVLTTAKSLVNTSNRRRKNAKFLTIGSPFVMNTNSSRIDHPFSPPISPPSRKPLLQTTTSFKAPLTSNTVFTSADSRIPPAFISAINEANPSSTTLFSKHISSTTPFWAEFPPFLTVTSCSYRTPCSTTVTYSLTKGPIFTTTVSPRVPFPITPYRPEVPLQQIASSSRSRITLPQTTLTSSANILTSAATSSRAGNLYPSKPPPYYRRNVQLSSADASSRSSVLTPVTSSSREEVLETTASSSSERLHILPSKPHPGCKQISPLSSTVSPSWFSVSPFQDSSSSKAGAFASTDPAFKTSDRMLATVSPSARAFRSSRSSVLTLPPSSLRANVPESTASSRSNVLTSVPSSSRKEVLKRTAPSSKIFHFWPSKPHLAYRQTDHLSSTVSTSWFRVPLFQNPSSKAGVYKSTASSARENDLKSTVPSSNVSDHTSATVSPSASSCRLTTRSSNVHTSASSSLQYGAFKTTAQSSSERLDILSCEPHLAYKPRAPLSSTVSPSWFRVPVFQNSSPSKAGVLTSAAPSSTASHLTSDTVSPSANAFRSSAPSSGTEISFSQTASTSSSGISISPITPSGRNSAHLSQTASTSRIEKFSLSTASSSSRRITRSMNASHSNNGASRTISTKKTSLSIPKQEKLI